MTPETALLLGRVTLGLYGLLLAAGGTMGYVKAGSRPSLIAGLASGAIALVLLGVTFGSPRVALMLAILLGAAMSAVFAMRLKKTGKFMPSGMLLAVSVVEMALTGLAFANL